MARSIEEVFHDHLTKRAAGDVEGDITENYSPDVTLLTGTGSFKGHDGVRQQKSWRRTSAKFRLNTTTR